MDYILMAVQVISMGLTWIYMSEFLMALLAKENTNNENNNKKYAWKLLFISAVAFLISILNLLYCDFVSISERITVFRWHIVYLIATVIMDSWTLKDAVYTKPQKYEKKVKVGTVILFLILTIFLVCTILKLYIYQF